MRYVPHWEWTSSVIFGLLIAVEGFWEYAAFVANSFIFLLIGIRVFEQQFTPVLIPAAIAIVLVNLSRALAVYPCSLLFLRALKIKTQH